jgi:hypothetical protein
MRPTSPGIAPAAGLDADITLVMLPADDAVGALYRRLSPTAQRRSSSRPHRAPFGQPGRDLPAERREVAAEAGLEVSPFTLRRADRLLSANARHVPVSRAALPALSSATATEGRLDSAPVFGPHHRGAGLTGGAIAVGPARA